MQAVAKYLARERAVNVTVFEPGPDLWRGRAFQPDGDEVLANVPMEDMSARGWDRNHGIRWLRDRGLHHLANDMAFPPRALVGRYLEETTEQAVAELRAAGSGLRVEKLTVQELRVHQGRIWMHGEGWHAGPFDNAVLCMGAPSAYDHYALTGAPGFIAEPYPLHESLQEVPESAKVGIVGAGLTAVDVVMALRARGHQGSITLTSRNGLLPAVRRPPVHHELHHLTVQRIEGHAISHSGLLLADVHELAKAELAEAGADAEAIAHDLACTAPSVHRPREELARALQSSAPGWSILRDGMVACGQDAWYLLTEQDKQRVLAKHEVVMRHCCPMPPGNAQRLIELFDTDQLALLPGIRSIRKKPGGGFVLDAASREVAVDVVVAASTPSRHVTAIQARPLMASMSAQGLVVNHSFGGLRVDRTTSRLLTSRGVADPRLHVLGDLTHGAYLFTFGMAVLSTRAHRIVSDIVTAAQRGTRHDHVPIPDGQGTADDRTARFPGPG